MLNHIRKDCKANISNLLPSVSHSTPNWQHKLSPLLILHTEATVILQKFACSKSYNEDLEGPVAKTCCSQGRWPGFDPMSGNTWRRKHSRTVTEGLSKNSKWYTFKRSYAMVPISGKKIQMLTRLSKVLLQPDPPPGLLGLASYSSSLSHPTISSRLFSKLASRILLWVLCICSSSCLKYSFPK